MLRKIVALLLVICLCGLLFGCTQQGSQKKTESHTAIAYSFEKTIRPVGMKTGFGSVKHNAAAEYVSEGNKSIQLEPMAEYESNLCVYFPLRSDLLTINYTDLNYLESIKLDVYSQDKINVGFGFYFSEKADLLAEASFFELEKGWNSIHLPVQHSLIALQYDLAECYGLYVQFEAEAVEKNTRIWVDNIQVTTTTEAAQIEQSIILDEYDGYCELADFEHAYQQILCSPYTTYNRAQLPQVSVVKAADYGLEAPSGEKVLRIESYPSTNYGNGSSWTQLSFANKWFDTLDITRFDPEKYILKFNIYQEGDISTLLELNLYHAYGMEWDGITSVKGQWVEYSAPLSKFSSYMQNPSNFTFSWLDWDPAKGDSCVFYIDHIRIERAEA